jgi:hypothetical protein
MKGHKYHAQPTTVDNVRFDSKAEARRYAELKLLLKSNQIDQLEVHPIYVLHAGNHFMVGTYEADFCYRELTSRLGAAGVRVVEDVKGMKTALYRWKKKHFEIEYAPLKISEVR